MLIGTARVERRGRVSSFRSSEDPEFAWHSGLLGCSNRCKCWERQTETETAGRTTQSQAHLSTQPTQPTEPTYPPSHAHTGCTRYKSIQRRIPHRLVASTSKCRKINPAFGATVTGGGHKQGCWFIKLARACMAFYSSPSCLEEDDCLSCHVASTYGLNFKRTVTT